MQSGGGISVRYLGAPCEGYAAAAPHFRVRWTGHSRELRVFFVASNSSPSENTTLIIRRPDGSWICDDDYSDEALHPMVAFRYPLSGEYSIWVGSLERGVITQGNLHITERGIHSLRIPLDPSANPKYSLELKSGFPGDWPFAMPIIGGGTVNLGATTGCNTYVTEKPTLRLRWSGMSDVVRIFFKAQNGNQATVIVRLPDGSWICDDDSGPIERRKPWEGDYNIWIGSPVSGDSSIDGMLYITELEGITGFEIAP